MGGTISRIVSRALLVFAAACQSAKKRAEEYQTETTACLEVDDRMSIREDRERMVGIAEHWLKVAALAN